MSGSPTAVSIRPSARRKLAVAAALAVVLVAIGLSLTLHRASPSSQVPHAATAGTSGSYGATPPSQASAGDALANASLVGSETIGGYFPPPSQASAGDALANASLVGSETIGDYFPPPSQSPAGDALANASLVGSEMIGDYVPTTLRGGPVFGPGSDSDAGRSDRPAARCSGSHCGGEPGGAP